MSMPFDRLEDSVNPIVPDLSPGVADLLAALSSADMDPDEFAKALKFHPVIASRLIALANSAWSAPETVVTDLTTACIRLGLTVVRSSAIAYAVAAPFDLLRCPAFDAVRFWCCSLLGADAAEFLARCRGLDTGLARTGGLLRNIGLLWLSDIWPEQTGAALAMIEQQPDLSLARALEQTAGLSHLRAGHHLFNAWGLPAELLDACDQHSNSTSAEIWRTGSQTAQAVYLAADSCPEFNGNSALSATEVEDLRAYIERQSERVNAVARSLTA